MSRTGTLVAKVVICAASNQLILGSATQTHVLVGLDNQSEIIQRHMTHSVFTFHSVQVVCTVLHRSTYRTGGRGVGGSPKLKLEKGQCWIRKYYTLPLVEGTDR